MGGMDSQPDIRVNSHNTIITREKWLRKTKMMMKDAVTVIIAVVLFLLVQDFVVVTHK